jgi:hypothetical protein
LPKPSVWGCGGEPNALPRRFHCRSSLPQFFAAV